MRTARTFVVFAALAACGPNNALPDAKVPPPIDAAPDAAPPDAALPMTVSGVRHLDPPDGTHLTLPGLVVVGHVAAGFTGSLWVQDAGGGPYTGMRVFCDFSGSAPKCPLSRSQFDALAVGTIVNVAGKYQRFLGTGAPAGAEPVRELDATSVVSTGGTAAPATVDATAADLASDNFVAGSSSDKYKGAYVRVIGAASFTVSDIAASTLATTCTDRSTPAQTGATYAGFDLTGGATAMIVGLGFHDTLTYCLPCTGVAMPYPCTKPVTASETFSAVKGIVEPAWNGTATYLQISPALDADLAP